MPCLFCGAERKMSREHLWPRWGRRTFEPAERRQQVPHSLERGRGQVFKAWDAQVFSATLKRVCEPCNNGWMSALETRAQPHAEPLLLGERRTLDADAQRFLALWAYLKCLLFVAFDEQLGEAMAPAYPTFYSLRDKDLLPPHTSVFIAHHVGPRQGQYQHRLLGEPDRPSLFLQTLTIRRLTLQVVKNYFAHRPIVPQRDPAVEGADRLIWPASGQVDWPPDKGLDDEGLTVFTGPQPGDPSPRGRNRAERRALRRARRRRRS